jgi:hypothetical protein
LYPFSPRHLTIVAPIVCSLLAQGIAFWRQRWIVRALAMLAVTLMIAAWPQPSLADFSQNEELRPVMAALVPRLRDDEQVWVYPGACSAFRYYARRLSSEQEGAPVSFTCGSSADRWLDELRALVDAGPTWAMFTRCVEPACRAELDRLRAEWPVTESIVGGPDAFALRLEP